MSATALPHAAAKLPWRIWMSLAPLTRFVIGLEGAAVWLVGLLVLLLGWAVYRRVRGGKKSGKLGKLGATNAAATPRAAAQFWFPPGYTSNEVTAERMKNPGPLMMQARDGSPFVMQTGSVDEFVDAGIAFAGNPDTVFEQIKEFNDHVGGIGHLLMMGQGGHLSHEDTVANLTMFSEEVMPRLQGL